MGWMMALTWGGFGAFCFSAIDFITAVRRYGKVPWSVGKKPPGPLAYLIAEFLRIVVGGGAVAAIEISSPSSITPWIAVITGSCAVQLLEKATLLLPLMGHMGKQAIISSLGQMETSSSAKASDLSVNSSVDEPPATSTEVGP
ncbi:hypothetical protein ACWDR3_42825 [Streptomyces sp. NPDC001002]